MKVSSSILQTTALVSVLLLSNPELLAACESLVDGFHELEDAFVDDCTTNQEPHGYYGGFFQPCEFVFFQSNSDGDSGCSAEDSVIVSKPRPVQWLFKLSEHIDKDDWDSLSSDDLPDFDELMLWPDQCVAVAPRCYKLGTNGNVDDELVKLFPAGGKEGGIPAEATHVRVDCRTDAMEISRVVYSFASGIEKSIPTLLFWFTTVVLIFLVAMSFCCYGCFRLCVSTCKSREVLGKGTGKVYYVDHGNIGDYHAIPAEATVEQDHVEMPINKPVKKYSDF